MPQTRLLSLDAFRGLTIAAMVLVNNPGTWGAVYRPLRHAAWHGLTPTDVVFPFFLFIVGMAIPPSLEGRAVPSALGRVLRRAAIIFALGLLLNAIAAGGDWSIVRIPGVLQRIALCYLVAALVFLATGWRTQAALTLVLLFGYWAVLLLVAAPGHQRGDLTPEGNVAAWLDRAVLGRHVWKVSRVYDPEGMLSTLPAIATTLIGMLAGRWVRGERPPYTTAYRLTVAGTIGVAVGLAWARWLPLNKSLWTSSYALFTGGLALLAFSACYWAIEIRGREHWARPFVVLGVNALAVFFLSTLLTLALTLIRVGDVTAQRWLFQQLFAPWASPVNASLAYAAAYLAAWWAVMYGFYFAGIRIRA